jgi:hypothetical protein
MRDKRTSPARPRPDGQQQGLSPAERTLRARLAAHTMHAKHDARETTAAARAAFLARFEAEVDPQGVLPAEERHRRAQQARSAYFTRLAFERAKAARRAQMQRETQTPGGEVA